MKKVTKAVIPAAGLGTRMLPISHAVPKEMLPIVDLPAIYYLVEEAARSGITDVLIITGRGKGSMEDFFDLSPEYLAALTAKGRHREACELRRITELARVYFLRQTEARGLGDAVGLARSFVGGDPFAVLYGDDVIFSKVPVCRQLIDAYEHHGRPVVGTKSVSTEELNRYCSLKTSPIDGESRRITLCTDIIEKPEPGREFSSLAILGRALLTEEIFDEIDRLTPGVGGEYQLTDAMAALARRSGIISLEFEGERFDMGSKLGFLSANLIRGLDHPETAEGLAALITDLSKKIGSQHRTHQ